jgi:Bacterial regulatory proteins, gntR family
MTTQSLRHDELHRPPPIPSQTDVVVDGIKSMIIHGQLSPGARLPREKDLALELNVSRGPLREGVRSNHLRVAGMEPLAVLDHQPPPVSG